MDAIRPKRSRRGLHELTLYRKHGCRTLFAIKPITCVNEKIVRQECPEGWPVHYGAVPLFVEATLQDNTPVVLTPCANLTMTALSVDDPYILRFANIALPSPMDSRVAS